MSSRRGNPPITIAARLQTRARHAPNTLRRVCAAAAALLAAGGLAACGADDKLAPNCPQTGILADAADITLFRAAGTDLTDMVLDGRITGLSGKCALEDASHLHTVISVTMELARGPAAKGRQQDVSYFVSVARGAEILDKKTYKLAVAFDSNATRIRLTGDQTDLSLPVNETVKGSDYSILVGFQLTPEELALNRRRGPR